MRRSYAPLSLQQKVSVTLLAVMAALVVLSYLVLQATVTPAFDRMELAAADTNLVRAKRAIESDLDNLSSTVSDWAFWDDAYAYARGEYPAFEMSNLNRPTLEILDLDLLIVFDASENLRWGQLVADGEARPLAALGVFGNGHASSRKLASHPDVNSRVSGLLQTTLGPMLLSSQPILTSNNEGPIAGTMIMGRFLDEQHLASLQERTEVAIDWHVAGDPDNPAEVAAVLLDGSGAGHVQHQVSPDAVAAYTVLDDLHGQTLLVLQADTPRAISALGTGTVNGALLFLSIAGLVIVIVAWNLLRWIIVRPLERLNGHIAGIRQSGDLSARLDDPRGDEIGALAAEFNAMTGELHRARQLLLEQSFKAGKADTAAEVLHNIRNAMTPLVNGIDRVADELRFAGDRRISDAVAQLAAPDCAPERREKLLQYIETAHCKVRSVNEGAIRHLGDAARQARQVEAILNDQERHANVAPVVENLDLKEMLEEAILVIPKADRTRVDVQFGDGLDRFRVRGHRVGLMQVLGNLVLNAYEAIERSGSEYGRITLSATTEEESGEPMVCVSVEDSGCGFDDKDRLHIFQRGFSSKQGHMSGLGLHWCANALSAMGGCIRADSEGNGRGARFDVLLPAA